MRLDEGNGKAMGMVKVSIGIFWKFQSSTFWKKFAFLASAPTFGLGKSRLWYKDEEL